MTKLMVVGMLGVAAAGLGLSHEALEARAQEAQVEASVDARQRQVLGGLLRAQRAGALARR